MAIDTVEMCILSIKNNNKNNKYVLNNKTTKRSIKSHLNFKINKIMSNNDSIQGLITLKDYLKCIKSERKWTNEMQKKNIKGPLSRIK